MRGVHRAAVVRRAGGQGGCVRTASRGHGHAPCVTPGPRCQLAHGKERGASRGEKEGEDSAADGWDPSIGSLMWSTDSSDGSGESRGSHAVAATTRSAWGKRNSGVLTGGPRMRAHR
jgi:hypothetical protein